MGLTQSHERFTAAELLEEYGRAPSPALLDRLFGDFVNPLLAEAAGRAVRKLGQREHDLAEQAAEVRAEVCLQLHSQLVTARERNLAPIRDLRAYLNSAVYNACFMRLRAKAPRRARLSNRLRFLLRNDSRFAMWEADGRLLSGVAKWRGQANTVATPRPDFAPADLAAFLESIFALAGGPLAWTELASLAAEVLGVSDPPMVALNEGGDVAAPDVEPGATMDTRRRLLVIWEEVKALPTAQRVALLLNLRDPEGQGVIEWMPATGVASFSQLANALEMSEKELSSIWNDLPLDDNAIAARLGVARQQVINLRKSGRARISRHLSGNGRETGNNPGEQTSTTAGRSLRRAGAVVRRFFAGRGEEDR